MATATVPVTAKRKSSVMRKSTRKAPGIRTAIIVKRTNGESKSQIADDLGISRNTVTSVLELNDVEQQIAQYRRDALAIVPDAITAVHTQVRAGDGDLGLRVLERTGVVGDNAIDSARRAQPHVSTAINLLVQASGNVTVQSSDNTSAPVPNGTHNDTLTVQSPVSTCDAPTGYLAEPPTGKHPKGGTGRE